MTMPLTALKMVHLYGRLQMSEALRNLEANLKARRGWYESVLPFKDIKIVKLDTLIAMKKLPRRSGGITEGVKWLELDDGICYAEEVDLEGFRLEPTKQ